MAELKIGEHIQVKIDGEYIAAEIQNIERGSLPGYRLVMLRLDKPQIIHGKLSSFYQKLMRNEEFE